MKKLLVGLIMAVLIVGVPLTGFTEEQQLLPDSAEEIREALVYLGMCIQIGCWQCCDANGCRRCCICFIEEEERREPLSPPFSVKKEGCDSGETGVEGC